MLIEINFNLINHKFEKKENIFLRKIKKIKKLHIIIIYYTHFFLNQLIFLYKIMRRRKLYIFLDDEMTIRYNEIYFVLNYYYSCCYC